MVSMVTARAADAALTLPATSVALAVMLWVPSARVEAAMVQFPVAVGDAGADRGRAVEQVTVLPASAVPVKVGVVMLVMLSVLDTPLSDAAARSGVDGAAGAMVSKVTAWLARGPRLPARSTTCAWMLQFAA